MSSLDNSREETRRRKNALTRVENGSTTDWSRPCSTNATRRALRKSSNLPNPGTTVSPYVVLFSNERKIILLGVMSIAFSCIEIVSFKGYLDSTQSEFFFSHSCLWIVAPRSCPSFTFRCIVLQAASCTGSQCVEWAIWLVMTPLE